MSPRELAIAKIPTPILNVCDFKSIFGGSNGCSLPLDAQGLLRAVEMIALPGTLLHLLESKGDMIYRVAYPDYPADELFVDSRFLQPATIESSQKKAALPSCPVILERLASLEGHPYIWGGNWGSGIPQLLHYYPPQQKLDEKMRTIWTLQGVDCSGFLYEATEGFTPRNTSQLVRFGTSLPIQGKSAQEIIKLLKPLDMIVWRGHVVFVFDHQTAIESRHRFGVVKTSLLSRLFEIMQERAPANAWDSQATTPHFVINRWHPELLST